MSTRSRSRTAVVDAPETGTGAHVRALSLDIAIDLLLQSADRLGVRVLYERLEGGDCTLRPGLCVVRGERRLYLDLNAPRAAQARILRQELRRLEIETVYLPPVVREMLESPDDPDWN